ncbi:hypothetical protein TRIUR3_01715 [Triticum urartu]|uniref:Uncharacterized protein n=1 Tax=Triticum urartu TaxID=4572 RepID=M7YY05_TRIUA|nr:hypothetical protein TRIUR3_01715 [Triticum urartu]
MTHVVLELLQKNRDMTFGEVKLTIMIEDPRDVERKRLLGIEDPDELTRDDLADALVETWQYNIFLDVEQLVIIVLYDGSQQEASLVKVLI